MNAEILNKILEEADRIDLLPDGQGSYDFNYDGARIYKIGDGKTRWLLRTESWCGGNIEGECYRPFYSVISRTEAEDLFDASVEGTLTEEDCEGLERNAMRASKSPCWMRSVRERGDNGSIFDIRDEKCVESYGLTPEQFA